MKHTGDFSENKFDKLPVSTSGHNKFGNKQGGTDPALDNEDKKSTQTIRHGMGAVSRRLNKGKKHG